MTLILTCYSLILFTLFSVSLIIIGVIYNTIYLFFTLIASVLCGYLM